MTAKRASRNKGANVLGSLPKRAVFRLLRRHGKARPLADTPLNLSFLPHPGRGHIRYASKATYRRGTGRAFFSSHGAVTHYEYFHSHHDAELFKVHTGLDKSAFDILLHICNDDMAGPLNPLLERDWEQNKVQRKARKKILPVVELLFSTCTV